MAESLNPSEPPQYLEQPRGGFTRETTTLARKLASGLVFANNAGGALGIVHLILTLRFLSGLEWLPALGEDHEWDIFYLERLAVVPALTALEFVLAWGLARARPWSRPTQLGLSLGTLVGIGVLEGIRIHHGLDGLPLEYALMYLVASCIHVGILYWCSGPELARVLQPRRRELSAEMILPRARLLPPQQLLAMVVGLLAMAGSLVAVQGFMMVVSLVIWRLRIQG